MASTSNVTARGVEEMKRSHRVSVVGDFNWTCVQDNFIESYRLPLGVVVCCHVEETGERRSCSSTVERHETTATRPARRRG